MTDAAPMQHQLDPNAIAADLKKKRRSRDRRSALFKHIFLIACTLIMVYPLIWMVSASLKPDDAIFSQALSIFPENPQPENYPEGWQGLTVSFSRFFLNSTFVTLMAVIGNLLSCSFAAYAFARLEFTGKTLFFSLMMATLMIPIHVVLIPQYILFLQIGWVNTYLPLIVPKFLATDAFFVFLMVQFFRQLPKELDEAAMIDGCSPFKIYWAIILPLSMPAMATAAIFTFIWNWEDFLTPLIYLNDVEDYTVPLALRMFLAQDSVSQYGQMFAMSVLSILPIVIFFVIFQKFIIRGIAMSGLK